MTAAEGQYRMFDVSASLPKLQRILRVARIREAADANTEVREHSAAVERARQARVRASRARGPAVR